MFECLQVSLDALGPTDIVESMSCYVCMRNIPEIFWRFLIYLDSNFFSERYLISVSLFVELAPR